MHLKRSATPREWPVERKGTKYVIASRGGFGSVPVLIVVRNMLNLARTRKEVKKSIITGDVIVNGRKLKDEHYPVNLFDIVTIIPLKKSYKLIMNERGKYSIEEIHEKDTKEKIAKITNKRLLKGKKVQLNLSDGRSYISKIECKVGDSAVINLEKKNIDRIIPMEEHHEGLIVIGKNAGEKGKIVEIYKEKNRIKFLLEKMKKEIEVNPESIIVIK